MKLLVEIDAPEEEIIGAIEGIPRHWFRDQERSPIRLLAMALKEAYEKQIKEEPRQ